MEPNDLSFPADENAGLVIPVDAKYYLHTAAKWAGFLAIIGYIYTALIVLAALFYLVMGSAIVASMQQQAAQYPGSPTSAYAGLMGSLGAGISLVYLGFAVLAFFFAFYLYRFSTNAKRAVLFNSSADITKGINSLKSFFKLWGIVTIIGIALGILFFVFLVIFAASMASTMHA